ncbi:MAG TPA: class I SAM-dependent methyltransferase [Lacipirellulaceae bacterium]|jgi:hypothetical protein|nr:class I SAM-dependent methyltransferase [Lacipirellulaceae bacterium]
MTSCAELADIEWLTGTEAGAILSELAESTAPLHTTAARLRTLFSPAKTHLLLEQVELRRRATAKFAHPERMFFTRLGLEQSTDEWVAAYKAARFTPQRTGSFPTPTAPPKIADLCCGVGGDLMAFANHHTAIGIDRDPIAAHLAAINANAKVLLADVTEFDLDAFDAWHIDPDRRPSGHRTTSLEWCEPNLATIESLLTRLPTAALKLAPAAKLPAHLAERCELEWISRDRECKQLVAWHGRLAHTPGQHRATILSFTQQESNLDACGLASEITFGSSSRTITGSPNHPVTIASAPNRYIFDTDPAVTAAHLNGTLAAEHNLSALGAGATYLTGPSAIADAALACFEVQDVLPLRTADLARHLRAKSIGQLEIKKRGVEIDPEKLRRDLKLRGTNAATLLITKIATRPTAILAKRTT